MLHILEWDTAAETRDQLFWCNYPQVVILADILILLGFKKFFEHRNRRLIFANRNNLSYQISPATEIILDRLRPHLLIFVRVEDTRLA